MTEEGGGTKKKKKKKKKKKEEVGGEVGGELKKKDLVILLAETNSILALNRELEDADFDEEDDFEGLEEIQAEMRALSMAKGTKDRD